ncbi:MAG: L,D-transpeptidase family protein [Gammaproteobacteria bacterium]|nr:L,D-transpeptidase family protein [Gammaproteobacteria bacterium]
MSFDRIYRRRSVLAVGAIALLGAGAASLLTPETARAQFNQYRSFTDSGPVTQEDKDRRQAERDALSNRLSTQLRMDVPFVSEAAIQGMQIAIDRYRQIAAAGGWPQVHGDVTLRLGDSSAEIVKIRKHLIIEGDLPPGSRLSPKFDDAFRDGIGRYQIRNGLRVSGYVDKRTLKALRVTAPERLHQLQASLPRMKKLLRINRASRYVVVNVPAFTAQGIQKGQLGIESAVIVGQPSRATPKISAKIVEVNFFPVWSVPDSVARKDLIPAIRRDPSYLAEQKFSVMRSWGSPPLDPAQVDWMSPKVASYKFRQDAGPQNALGLVRINMPNRHSVYMHDTPYKRLFNQSLRAFSSGCVRVQDIYGFAAWLLRPQGWTRAKVEGQIASGRKKNVKLTRPVPVHLVYLTAFANSQGVAQFRPDIYGRDAGSGGLDEGQDALVVSESRAVTP